MTATVASCIRCLVFFCELYGDPRDLHVLTHSFPTRRSSDLLCGGSRSEGESLSGIKDEDTLLQVYERAMREQNHAILSKLHLKRSEEHTSELQSLMRISYAVFCLKKKKNNL